MIGAQIALALLLVVLVLIHRRLLDGPPGRLLALVALVAFPLFLTAEVGSYHLEHAERTRFCLACHEMAPFGRGLEAQDPAQLAAAHYQNHWVAPESACYACHTDYAMHGDLKAKLRGLQH
nr:hypothetical protein [Gammaproteobacteria bacterium]